MDDSPQNLASVVFRAIGARRLDSFIDDIGPEFTWRGRLVLQWGIREGWRSARVEEMAAAIGAWPRSMRRWFAFHPSPTPQRILAWGRVLHAAKILSMSGRDGTTVAAVLRFSSADDLRREFRRLVGRVQRFFQMVAAVTDVLRDLMRGPAPQATVLLVRYSDLVSDPRTVLTEIHDALELPPSRYDTERVVQLTAS